MGGIAGNGGGNRRDKSLPLRDYSTQYASKLCFKAQTKAWAQKSPFLLFFSETASQKMRDTAHSGVALKDTNKVKNIAVKQRIPKKKNNVFFMSLFCRTANLYCKESIDLSLNISQCRLEIKITMLGIWLEPVILVTLLNGMWIYCHLLVEIAHHHSVCRLWQSSTSQENKRQNNFPL